MGERLTSYERRPDTKYICCFSGGKDSLAMLIKIIENGYPLDEVLYCDVGDWMWESTWEHLEDVKRILGVDITILDIKEEIRKGFERWGFPSFVNRWCTGAKRDKMRDYFKEKYPELDIVQYIGYCVDEDHRHSKKLQSNFYVAYPLVDLNISQPEALQICYDYGFKFGGVYETHSHYNCWMCPLQRKGELWNLFRYYPDLWQRLREMQWMIDGHYKPNESVFQIEERFWKKQRPVLEKKRLEAREKYRKR